MPLWGLNDFAEKVNEFLPAYLPDDPSRTRVREDITPRLIRHHTTLGMLDEPLKDGREARYVYRHLLQILLVRRLLAEGYSSSTIGDLAKNKSDRELQEMLEGGMHLTLTSANPALAYLDKIKSRTAGTSTATPTPTTPAPTPRPPSSKNSRWTRAELLPGLELHISDSFRTPRTPEEQQNLLQLINRKIIEIHQRRSK